MAGNRSATVEVLIRMRDTTSRAIGEFRRRWQAGVRVVKEMATAFLATTAAATAFVFGLTKLVQQGDKVIGVQAAFARTTDDAAAALARLREASGGTISDFDLMSRHNHELALGTARSTEEFARMLEVSRLLAESLGKDDVEAFDKLANVMASGSQRAARELGLEIKAGATRNEVLKAAEGVVARLAGATDDASDSGDRFAATMTNVKNKLAVFVAESPIAAAFLDGLGSLISDAVDILMGDSETLIDGMKTLGRLAGDAFSLGVNLALREMLGSGPGSIGSLFQGNVDAALANLAANRTALGAIAGSANAQAEARRRARGGGVGAPGGAAPLDINTTRRDMSGFGLSPEGLAAYRARQQLAFDQLGRSPVASAGIAGAVRRFNADPRLPGIDVTVSGAKDAALELEDATGVAVDSFRRLGDAAVNESQRMESAIIDSFASIMANIKTKDGGLFGSTLLGGVLGIGLGLASSLFGRKREPVPVHVADYGPTALSQMKETSGPSHITTVIEQGGVEIERIERELLDRSNRDEVVRFSRGRALR